MEKELISVLRIIASDGYGEGHTAPEKESGSPMHDLSDIYPDDIYSHDAVNLYGWGQPGET